MAVALLTPEPRSQWFDGNGLPLAGGRLFTFESGTTTPKAIFNDFEGLVPLTNPAILGPDGRLTYRLLTDSLYSFRVEDSLGNLQYTEDNVGSISSGQASPNRTGQQATVRLTASSGDTILSGTGANNPIGIFPVGSIPYGVLLFVETSFGNGQGLTGFVVGTSINDGVYGRGISRLAGTTTTPAVYTNYNPAPVPGLTDLVVRVEGGPADGSGELFATVFYEEQTAVITLP